MDKVLEYKLRLHRRLLFDSVFVFVGIEKGLPWADFRDKGNEWGRDLCSQVLLERKGENYNRRWFSPMWHKRCNLANLCPFDGGWGVLDVLAREGMGETTWHLWQDNRWACGTGILTPDQQTHVINFPQRQRLARATKHRQKAQFWSILAKAAGCVNQALPSSSWDPSQGKRARLGSQVWKWRARAPADQRIQWHIS